MKIFENVSEKIKKYDQQSKSQQYNNAYRKVLEAKAGSSSLIGEGGNISDQSLEIIEFGLKAFGMDRFGKMDNEFKERLKKKLQRNDIKEILGKFTNLRIELQEWQKYMVDVEKLYNILSAKGYDGLSADGKRFDVGATKIMNFLFPELFVIVDRNVTKTLIKLGLIGILGKGGTYKFSFESYWQIMQICYQELEEFRKLHGNISGLLEFDRKPTTLTRIFDKCVFKMIGF